MAKEYDIAKPTNLCKGSGKELAPGEPFVAVLRETPEQLVREDYSVEFWQASGDEDAADVIGVWHTRVPELKAKKKLLIDDASLMSLFERLEGDERASRINFRYVLALILMRKKLLTYDHSEKDDNGRDVWRMKQRGTDRVHEVVDPHLGDDEIADVSEQISEIMEEPL